VLRGLTFGGCLAAFSIQIQEADSMKPEIEAYLRDHGARYTSKALRAQLISAGHDPAEIDAALVETEPARAPLLAAIRREGSRFWRLAFLINFIVLVGVTALLARSTTFAGAAFVVLGIAMLFGLLITGNIGRSLVPRTGLVVALAIPAVGALLLGGWCLSMIRGSVL
jgi:hypothetical protein